MAGSCRCDAVERAPCQPRQPAGPSPTHKSLPRSAAMRLLLSARTSCAWFRTTLNSRPSRELVGSRPEALNRTYTCGGGQGVQKPPT